MIPPDAEREEKSRLERQVKALRSGNRVSILDALREIRSASNISILPELFELLLDQEDQEITRETASLLNDLKNKEAAPILAEALNKEEFRPIAATLAAACWQNGLSYGKYADTFADLAVTGDFQTALEAFTVLEEAVGELEQVDRLRLSGKIKHGLRQADEHKKLLLRELVRVIETY
jgi:hypothetical protein